MQHVKTAICEALDRRSATVQGAKSVRVDIKFTDEGLPCKVIVFAEHEFTVRGRVPVERYEMNS
jgi:hypothetical protein